MMRGGVSSNAHIILPKFLMIYMYMQLVTSQYFSIAPPHQRRIRFFSLTLVHDHDILSIRIPFFIVRYYMFVIYKKMKPCIYSLSLPTSARAWRFRDSSIHFISLSLGQPLGDDGITMDNEFFSIQRFRNSSIQFISLCLGQPMMMA